ncbi:transcriptional regulator [Vibrio cidicii]|uniref:MarR family transcriptional regulator n=2 Tax=Vibrio TaxID=662 RepID=A0AAI9CTT5_9VIBR|nr:MULTISPECIES: MarR family transcriptional regulator [Vibrio]EGR2795900.1 MarR family transcriptional regulator [Vibrio navarrensis]EHA1126712.1 MarR family transcriptional regulator [Vibrio navarrensis]EJL6395502.1 MarR family transcriptional regulator [Vibrio navarrensis]EJL6399305.1 MarR family transcriptional regulator [Vibrio navarrensis]EJL6565527.1 MarR family transcriptional regulator [Vibrio navarrensis]
MDAIDRVVEQWQRERPELDTGPMALMGRMMRICKIMEARIAEVHKKYDLKMGEFDVLATLRRSGHPYILTPSELISSMLLTSGAMTNRLDKLESKGLIEREHSKEDRRSISVKLTENGLSVVDLLIEEHVAAQHHLVEGFEKSQLDELNQLMKGLLSLYE